MTFTFYCTKCDKDIVVSQSYMDVQAAMSRHGREQMHGGAIYMNGKMVMDNTAFVEMARAVKEGTVSIDDIIKDGGNLAPRKLTPEESQDVAIGEEKAKERAKQDSKNKG